MKNISILSVIILFFMLSACKKDDIKQDNKHTITGIPSLKEGRSASKAHSVKWVMKHAWCLEGAKSSVSFGYNGDRDTINGKFITYSDWAVAEYGPNKGDMGWFLTVAKDLRFLAVKDFEGNISGDWSETNEKYKYNRLHYPKIGSSFDTVAYIPNAVVERTRTEVRAALREGKDIDVCREIFNKAMVFIPITGDEYKELKAQGLN